MAEQQTAKQRATRAPDQLGAASIAGGKTAQLNQLAATLNAAAPVQRLASMIQRQPEDEELLQGKFATAQRAGADEEELLQGKFATVQRAVKDEDLLQGRFVTVQRAPEDEELLQGKFATVQRAGADEEELLQGKFATAQRAVEDEELLQGRFVTVQRAPEDEEELLQGKFATAQRAVEDEELLQGRFATAQRAPEDEELLQGKFATVQRAGADEEELQLKAAPANNTGLPDGLKSGVEALSGMSMDGVKVHYNSAKPAQLNAHAYAQGADIHLAPGQEQHLPHEAWHVVQQAQGRVKPTMQMKTGVPVNDDVGLEREADIMGARALRTTADASRANVRNGVIEASSGGMPIQRVIALSDADAGIYASDQEGEAEEYYYTTYTVEELPVFVPAKYIDELSNYIEVGVSQLGEMPKSTLEGLSNQVIAMALYKYQNNCQFFNDKGEVTDLMKSQANNALRMALKRPLIKDPNRSRGLAHRYTEPGGVLFSRVSKEQAEEKLGYQIPNSVSFYHVLGMDWNNEIEKYRSFWTETSDLFAYGRHVELRTETPRGPRSKLRHGTKISTPDHEDQAFKGDSLTSSLPPAVEDTTDTGWIEYSNYARSQDRGEGQYKAMSGWNALGYAAYMFHHGYKGLKISQDWEWLHIRGAQNGGKTDASNLVAGTSTTNSRMIPWEDKINIWSNHATREHPLRVKFQGARVSGTHLGKIIEILVATPNGLPGFAGIVPEENPMKLIFDPLNGTAFDRMSERLTSKVIVEEAMKAEGNVTINRNYMINKGVYKGYYFEAKGENYTGVYGIISAIGKQITLDKSMISLITRELTSPLPSKQELRNKK